MLAPELSASSALSAASSGLAAPESPPRSMLRNRSSSSGSLLLLAGGVGLADELAPSLGAAPRSAASCCCIVGAAAVAVAAVAVLVAVDATAGVVPPARVAVDAAAPADRIGDTSRRSFSRSVCIANIRHCMTSTTISNRTNPSDEVGAFWPIKSIIMPPCR